MHTDSSLGLSGSQQVDAVIATLVPESRRMQILPTYLGREFVRGEMLVYSHLSAMCPEYLGGVWDFFELSNGSFYMAPAYRQPFDLHVDGNGFAGRVSADAAGLIACLFAFNQLTWTAHDDRYIDLYYRLREFALGHAEAATILRAID